MYLSLHRSNFCLSHTQQLQISQEDSTFLMLKIQQWILNEANMFGPFFWYTTSPFKQVSNINSAMFLTYLYVHKWENSTPNTHFPNSFFIQLRIVSLYSCIKGKRKFFVLNSSKWLLARCPVMCLIYPCWFFKQSLGTVILELTLRRSLGQVMLTLWWCGQSLSAARPWLAVSCGEWWPLVCFPLRCTWTPFCKFLPGSARQTPQG